MSSLLKAAPATPRQHPTHPAAVRGRCQGWALGHSFSWVVATCRPGFSLAASSCARSVLLTSSRALHSQPDPRPVAAGQRQHRAAGPTSICLPPSGSCLPGGPHSTSALLRSSPAPAQHVVSTCACSTASGSGSRSQRCPTPTSPTSCWTPAARPARSASRGPCPCASAPPSTWPLATSLRASSPWVGAAHSPCNEGQRVLLQAGASRRPACRCPSSRWQEGNRDMLSAVSRLGTHISLPGPSTCRQQTCQWRLAVHGPHCLACA